MHTFQDTSGYREDTTVSFPLSEASPKDKPWDKHRANADKVQELYKQLEYDRYSERVGECSQRLYFALQKEGEEGVLRFVLSDAKFCRVRHCPVCQWRRSLMWTARFHKVLPEILKDYPKARFLFLTLTAKNCQPDQLRETIAWMNESWRKLVRRKSFPAIGSIKSVEVTRGSDGLAHPHFHIILIVRPGYFNKENYLSHNDWVKLWKQSLKVNYNPIVNVKAIKSKEGTEGIFNALRETLKYSVKEDDLVADKQWLKTLTNQLHKTRAVSVAGVFKQYLSEDEPEDYIHTEEGEEEVDQEAPEFTFTWREKTRKYMSE
jgi:plasmid rolling circle replication initiator protein Rep